MGVARVLSMLLALLAPLGVALASMLAPMPTGPVAAVFPPWWNAARAITSAGTAGTAVRFGAFGFVVVVFSADRAQLKSHGAWLLLDPVVTGGCTAPVAK
jgi:hypothetical protein